MSPNAVLYVLLFLFFFAWSVLLRTKMTWGIEGNESLTNNIAHNVYSHSLLRCRTGSVTRADIWVWILMFKAHISA